MADRNDLRAWNTAANAWVATAYNPDGSVIDLTGRTFDMQVRETADGDVLASLSVGAGTLTVGDDGKLYILLPENIATNFDPGRFFYDIRETVDGVRVPFTFGELKMRQGITHA